MESLELPPPLGWYMRGVGFRFVPGRSHADLPDHVALVSEEESVDATEE